MHRIAVFHNIYSMRLGCFLLFTLQIDDISVHQSIITLQVVILHQFLPADIKFLTQILESIPAAGHDISDIIGDIHRMRTQQPRVLSQFTFRVDTFAVIFIQVVIFDNRNQSIGIGRVCGVSCLFQSACPSFVIGDIEFEKEGIAGTSFQKVGMVFVRLAGMLVGTETFIAGIVIMTYRTSAPTAATLNTEVIITLACQLAVSGSAFKQSLCQSDACGNFVKLHLLHSQVTILIYIFYITCIPSLCLYSYGKEDNGS